MLTQDDLDWLGRIATTGDIGDSQFVQFCDRQLTEDLYYLDASTELFGRYATRLKDRIKRRIRERAYDCRYSACRVLGGLLQQPGLDKQFGSRESVVRSAARSAFF